LLVNFVVVIVVVCCINKHVFLLLYSFDFGLLSNLVVEPSILACRN